MRQAGIYYIRNLINGKFYLGRAVDINARWRQHRGALRKGTHDNKHLQRSFQKYGEDSFRLEIRVRMDPVEALLINIEQQLLDRWVGQQQCYNINSNASTPDARVRRMGTLAGMVSQKANRTGMYDPEARARAHAVQRAKGTGFYDPNTGAKGRASQKANGTGFFNADVLARTHATQKANGTGLWNAEAQARIRATQKANGTGVYDPEAQARSRATQKANGTGIFSADAHARSYATQKANGIGIFAPGMRAAGGRAAMHLQWHVNRGIQKPGCSLCFPPPAPNDGAGHNAGDMVE